MKDILSEDKTEGYSPRIKYKLVFSIMSDWLGKGTFAFLLIYHQAVGQIVNITMVNNPYNIFLQIKFLFFQLKNPAFREGESSGGPEYMFHVSGDGVEMSRDRGSHKAQQGINRNLNRHQPQKVPNIQPKPGFLKQESNLNQNFGFVHPRPWSGGFSNLHQNLNGNLNRQHHQAINQDALGHTTQRRILRRNPGPGYSGDLSGLHKTPNLNLNQQPQKASNLHKPLAAKLNFNRNSGIGHPGQISGDYTVAKKTSGHLDDKKQTASNLHEPGVATQSGDYSMLKQQKRNLNHHNFESSVFSTSSRDYAMGTRSLGSASQISYSFVDNTFIII